MKLPEKYTENMKTLLKEDFSNYLESFNEQRAYGLRVNTLKITTQELTEKIPFNLDKITWCNEGFYYSKDVRAAKHPYYHCGLYYLQEPSAMSPVSILLPKEGDNVLDLCAAPGGKTTQIGAFLKNKGVLFANDISAGRTKALIKNIELFGIKNCVVTSENPKKLEDKFKGFFDKILVDAPCSGEGMFRKEPDIIKNWNEEMISFCIESQKDILESAAKMLKSGGRLLYSTCTFSPLENEKTINDFLESHKDFKLLPINESLGFENGNPLWVENGNENLKFTKRLWPHKIKGEGHFLALLEKNSTEDAETFNYEENLTDKRIDSFNKFKEEFLNLELDGIYQIINNCLYLLPQNTPVLKGLRVMRSGLLLGEFKKDRFEPSQAFAMSLKEENVLIKANLTIDDERVMRYLKGETIDFENLENGWCVVFCDGFPLGFGKSLKGRIKNKYPVSWFWN